jgi:hypothetical protein
MEPLKYFPKYFSNPILAITTIKTWASSVALTETYRYKRPLLSSPLPPACSMIEIKGKPP